VLEKKFSLIMYRYIATSRAKNNHEHSAHTCCSYGAKKNWVDIISTDMLPLRGKETSNLKPQTEN